MQTEAITAHDTLLHDIMQGNEAAFEQLFKAQYAGFCSYAFSFLKDSDEAEEIVQEVMVRFWQKRNELNITGAVNNYLLRWIRNSCLNRLRHEKVKQLYETEMTANPMEADNSGIYAEEAELSEKIAQVIDKLPTERGKIFKMSRFEQLSYREIAEQLNLSIKTVENQMGKALKFLRAELAEYLPLILALLHISFFLSQTVGVFFHSDVLNA